MLIEDKIALITGAAQGLGRGIAEVFASEGAHVVLCDINEEGVRTAAREIALKTGRKAKAFRMDVSKKQEVQAVVEAVDREFGRIDILVNAAGVIKPVPFLELDEENWDWHFNVNVKGPFLLS